MPVVVRKIVPQLLRSLNLDERWLQEQILADPSLLNLGELVVVHRERPQASGGRLDFLMRDPATERRYEIELMLGATDPSHIIRCIEYWDLERQRYPSYEHCAVIVAEKIAARFFNVIRLLNRSVPIIAIQLSALPLGNGELTLQFTKVLDEGLASNEDEEDTPVQADRAFWEKRSSAESLAAMDQFIALVGKVTQSPRVNYRQSNIAIAATGRQFAWLNPRKGNHCFIGMRVGEEQRAEVLELLDGSGIGANPRGLKSISMQLTRRELSSHPAVFEEVIRICVTASLRSGVSEEGEA